MFFLKMVYKRVPLVVVPLIMAGLLFVSCGSPADDPVYPVNAATPTISAQPQGGTFDVGGDETFVLTVTASKSDNGTLSYQWYSNGSNSTTGGTAIGTASATSDLTLEKDDFPSNVTKYYYVIVTNKITDNGDGGKKAASKTSNVVEVIVDGVGGSYLNAKLPVIETLTGGTWDVSEDAEFELTVEASVDDGGTLSYQWYSNTSNSTTDGTAISTGGTSATLTLAKANYTTNKNYYFYVLVTNTNNDVSGNTTTSKASNVATVTVTGNSIEFTIPEGLKGTWVSDYGEEFIITATTFSSQYDGDVTYEGTIVNHRADGADGGYITIQYTTATYYSDGVGKFYVIHYTDLTATTVSIAGAYDEDDPEFADAGGKVTQADAETAYTVEGGCFSMYSDCTKDSSAPVNAQQPSISAQPGSTSWNVSTTPSINLTVTASVTDGGTLGYQWYSNSTNSNSGGTAISTGGTSATLSLAKANYTSDTSYYFYVIVTNTNNSVTGNNTAIATSNVATVTVSGNSSTPEVVIPAEIVGFWQTEHSLIDTYWNTYSADPLGPLYWADSFSVDSTTKTLRYYMDTSFETYWAGTVVQVIEQDDDSGEPAILIVHLTEVEGDWWTEPEVGKYFAYSYKNVAGDIVSSAQAYSSGLEAKNTGVATLAEAVSEYTADNGYYDQYGTYKKRVFDSASVFDGIQGSWYGEDEDFEDYRFQIRGNAYVEFFDDPDEDSPGYYDPDDDWDISAAVGLIVDCTDTTQASGVLYVQVLGSDMGFLNFKFIAVGWRNKTSEGIDFATSSDEYDTLTAAKEAHANADSFVEANYSSYFKE